MQINIRALTEYLQCPLQYKLRYVNKLVPQKRYIVYDAFEQAMHQLFYYLFYQVQNNYYPSSYHLKRAWGRIWCPGRSREEIIGYLYSNAKKITYNPKLKERQGLELGLLMLEHYKKKPGTPILIGKAYTIPFGRHTLCGIIELVREIDGQLEIADVRTSAKRMPVVHIKHDIELTAASYATRYLLREKEDRVVYYYLDGNKQFTNTRDTKDYKNLHNILDRTEQALKKNLFWPSMNDTCSVCSFRLHCSKKEWY